MNASLPVNSNRYEECFELPIIIERTLSLVRSSGNKPTGLETNRIRMRLFKYFENERILTGQQQPVIIMTNEIAHIERSRLRRKDRSLIIAQMFYSTRGFGENYEYFKISHLEGGEGEQNMETWDFIGYRS